MIPPASRMGMLTEPEMRQALAASAQVREYAEDLDRESARELLAARMSPDAAGAGGSSPEPGGAAEAGAGGAAEAAGRAGGLAAAAAALAGVLKSPLVKTIAGRATTQVTRGLMGELLGTPARRRRR
jgi:hypothetical protein